MKTCKNDDFRHIPVFSAGKICFLKTGLGHILDIAILHQCAKFHVKKYKVQLEKFNKYRFTAKIGCSGDF